MHRGERDQLIEDHRDLVRRIVHRTIAMMNLPAENFDDYESAAFLGLVEAADRFDPACGVSFKSFSYLRIRGSIIDYIREHSDLTGSAYRYARAIHALENAEEDALSGLATYAGATKEESLSKLMNFAAQASLSYRLTSYEMEPAVELVEDERRNPEDHLEFVQDIDLLRESVTELPDKERFIVEGYYFKGKSFVELTHERPELSKSWVSRLHTRALERLGKVLEEKRYASKAA